MITAIAILVFGALLPTFGYSAISPGGTDVIQLSAGKYTVNGVGQVTGTVTSASGLAIQDEPLYWKVSAGGPSVASGGPVYSGSTGGFSITIGSVPTGTYTLYVSEASDFCSNCGLAQTHASYVSSAAALYVLTVKVATSGGPVPPNPDGALVTVSQGGSAVGSCITDASDSCGVSLANGQYSVSGAFQGYASQAPTTVSIDGTPLTVQITLTQVQLYGEATLTFRAPDGSGVSGVVVTAGNRQVTTGSNGTVNFSLPEGTYTFTFSPPSQYGSAGSIPNVQVKAGQDFKWSTTFGSYQGTLIFRDTSTGANVSGVQVSIAALSLQETTGANGSVSFDGDSGQTYAFTYTPPSAYGPQASGSITLTSNPGTNAETVGLTSSTTSPSCTLNPSSNAGLNVLVVDASGGAVPNAKVSAGGVTALTDSSGHALLCNFAVPGGSLTNFQGQITVSVSASGYSSASQPANVIEGQVGSTVVQLTKGFSGGGSPALYVVIVGVVVLAIGLVAPSKGKPRRRKGAHARRS